METPSTTAACKPSSPAHTLVLRTPHPAPQDSCRQEAGTLGAARRAPSITRSLHPRKQQERPKTTVRGNFADEDGHPWLTPADLTGYRDKHVSRGRRNLTDQGLANSSAKYMPAGSILFSSRAPIGYVAIAANALTTNQGFRSFVPSDALDSDFAFHYLKSIRALAEQFASGTTFNELSGSKAKTLPLPLPPLAEQQRIAARLDEIETQRRSAAEHLLSARTVLGQLRGALFTAACSGRLTAEWRSARSVDDDVAARDASDRLADDPAVELPPSWMRKRLGSVFRVQNGRAFPSKQYQRPGDVRLLRPGNLRVDGTVEWNERNTVGLPQVWAEDFPQFLLGKGELVMNLTAQSLKDEFLGRVCLKLTSLRP